MSRVRASLAATIGLALLLGAGPVAAHALKLFVTVDGTTISGHGFFIGGGRPQGVVVKIRDASGRETYEGRTDASGAFAWAAPAPGTYVVALDTGDGHFVETTVPADRFLAPAPGVGTAATAPASAAPASPTAAAVAANPAAPASPGMAPAALAALIETSVDRALARRLTPLIEAQERDEARLRFNDVMGGIGMIVGLGGLAAWAMARRRERRGPDA